MKKTGVALAAAYLMWGAVPVFAAGDIPLPSKYIITIESLKLKNNTGEWVTVIEPDREVDLSSEEAKVSFFNKGRVPEGRYINFKVGISKVLRVAGHDRSNKTAQDGWEIIGGTAKTAEDLPGEITLFEEKAPTWTQGSEGQMHVELRFGEGGGDSPITLSKKRDLAEALEVKKNSFIHVWFVFNLEGTLFHASRASLGNGFPKGDAMVAFPPKKVEEVHIAVDDKNVAVDGADVIVQF